MLSLIFAGVDFDSVGSVAALPDFLIWSVSGWTMILWMAMGGLGLLAVPRLGTARAYALFAGILIAAVAVWGFIDGNDVVELIAADTTNNITHAVLAGLGLTVGMLPRDTQRPPEERASERRFGPEQRESGRGETIGRDAR